MNAIPLIIAAVILLVNYSLAVQISFFLYILAGLEVLFALGLIVLTSRQKKKWSINRISVLIALLSPLLLLHFEPYFVNQLVARAGPTDVLNDARKLCEAYEQDPDKFKPGSMANHIPGGDPRLGSISKLHPLYATISSTSVDLKMGGMMDSYSGISIEPGNLKESAVDWSLINQWKRSNDDGLERASRVIGPGFTWEEWSAP